MDPKLRAQQLHSPSFPGSFGVPREWGTLCPPGHFSLHPQRTAGASPPALEQRQRHHGEHGTHKTNPCLEPKSEKLLIPLGIQY